MTKTNIESCGCRGVLLDLDGALMLPVQRWSIPGIEQFLELPRAFRGTFTMDVVNLDRSLQGIQVNAAGLDHEPVHNKRPEPSKTGLNLLSPSLGLDHQMAHMIQLDLEPHFPRARPSLPGKVRTRLCLRRRRFVRWRGHMFLVNLMLQPDNAIRVTQRDPLPINLHGPIRQDVVGLWALDQAPRDPLVVIHLCPRLASLQDHGLLSNAERKDSRVSLGVCIDAGSDPPLRRFPRRACRQHPNGPADEKERDQPLPETVTARKGRRYHRDSDDAQAEHQRYAHHHNGNACPFRVPGHRAVSRSGRPSSGCEDVPERNGFGLWRQSTPRKLARSRSDNGQRVAR